MTHYRIEKRPADSDDDRDWSGENIGETADNRFKSRLQAERCIGVLRSFGFGPEWSTAQYRVVEVEKCESTTSSQAA